MNEIVPTDGELLIIAKTLSLHVNEILRETRNGWLDVAQREAERIVAILGELRKRS